MHKKLQALGRLKKGAMNKTELAYSHLLEVRKACGEVAWWRFEAIKLMIAPNTSITIDFFVMLSNGELQAHDTKGSKFMMQDDAHAKTKVAASIFPWAFYYAFPDKAVAGGFRLEEV